MKMLAFIGQKSPKGAVHVFTCSKPFIAFILFTVFTRVHGVQRNSPKKPKN